MMGKKSSLLAAALCAASLTFAQPWALRTPFQGGPRTAAVGFSIGNYGYITTGVDSASFRRNMYRYDPATDGWLQVTSLGGATGNGLGRDMAVCFVVSPNAYIGTGQGGQPYLKDLWQYSSLGDFWTQKANFPGGNRRGGVAFTVNGKGYVCTGQDSVGFRNDTWEYNPTTNVWTQKANFIGTPRRLAIGFAIGSKGYVGTGDDGTFKNDFFEYDPGSNVWVAKAGFPGTPRYGASAMVINNKGYVGCGYDNQLQNCGDFWEYDPSTNFWSPKSSFFGTRRSNAVAFAINNLGYLGTGYDGVVRDDFWVFDPLQTGIPEIQELQAEVFPCPVSTGATFRFKGQDHTAFTFRLFDLEGKVVAQEAFTGNEFAFARGALAGGVYTYSIISDHAAAQGKLILLN
jgi:N-acetylneuraminic acid mutarotase